MCRFQWTSHWIVMLRTSRASDFLIFMPSIGYLKLSSRNCFNFNIVSDLIKCFTIILVFFFYFNVCINFSWRFYLRFPWTHLTIFTNFFLIFDNLMYYLSGSYAYGCWLEIWIKSRISKVKPDLRSWENECQWADRSACKRGNLHAFYDFSTYSYL